MVHHYNGEQPRFLLVDDADFDTHESESLHPERPARLPALRRAVAQVSTKSDAVRLKARDVSNDELARVHTETYITKVDQAAGLQGHFDADTYHCPTSVTVARRAAGGCVELVERLVAGDAAFGTALVRPPGHHATRDSAMGFCILNNVAVAAAHARVLGVERVAIVDWDVHHGNGTEEIFYDDPSVLYVSLHQAPFYPGTGAIGDVGTDEGAGYTVNIPLSASADLATYTSAIDRIVGPILSTYAPGLLLISAGYDAHARDPLGAMRLDDAAYGTLFEHLYKALPTAGDACRQRPSVGIVLEGGYDTQALEGSFRATLQAALACTSNPRSVYAPPTPAAATDAPSHTHRRQIALAQAVQQRYWPLT